MGIGEWQLPDLRFAMRSSTAVVLMSFLAVPFAFELSAADFCPRPGFYELLPGSTMRINCFVCELVQDRFNLAGRFLLSQTTQPGLVFGISDLDLRDEEGRGLARVTGTGSLEVSNATQILSLEVALSGGAAALLKGSDTPGVSFPEIDVEALLDPQAPRQGVFIESIRLVARPVPAEKGIGYRLADGSYFLDSCNFCGRNDVPVPIGGTFDLVQVVNAGPFASYRVECLRFTDFSLDPIGFEIAGYGSYRRVEEFSIHHEMVLDLETRAGPQSVTVIVVQSGSVLREKPFPLIEIDLTQSNPSSSIHIRKLHLIAEPAGAMHFRRGDPNEDGALDLSDPTAILSWLFLGSAAPACLDGADANGDGAHDLSDAVFLLGYLFTGGDPPPAPGPAACGSDPAPKFGCERYDACAVR
jgi:hypothetical protein